MIRNTDGTERLYLSKEADQSIYIDNCKIPQHHLNGVRFLYRQYKKKKPGVIINETTGFSRSLQIVLFVKAMCHIFEQPVLVLCQEGAEHSWMEQFQTWTDLYDDVVLESKKPYIKKKVLVNTMSNLSAFCSRNWSVLAIDVPEMDKASLHILGLPFKADYKIWITPINMREHLDHFSRIYKWLYPKEEFDKNIFIPKLNSLSDVVDKAILLDAFMEDIVTRNEETQGPVEYKQINESPRKRITLKNKDATGTKIKRSKRKIYDANDDKPKNTESKQITLIKNREFKEDFSIDNFKRKRKEFDENVPSNTQESETGVKIDTLNIQSEVNLFYEPDSSTDNNSDRLYEMDTLVFSNDTCDELSVNVNETVNEIIETTENNYLLQEEDRNKETNFGKEEDTPSDNVLDNQEIGNLYISNNDISTTSASTLQIQLESNEVSKENYVHVKDRIATESSSIGDELQPKTENDYEEIKSCLNTESCQLCDDGELKPNTYKIFISDEVQLESNCKSGNDVKSLVTNNTPVTVSNALKHKCNDDKLKELEEKVMKRFKGSILDSLI